MIKYLFIISIIFVSSLVAQSITFHVDYLLAGPSNANWMFEFDDVGYNTNDGNPYTPSGNNLQNNYAYRHFTWASNRSTSICNEEQLNVLPNVDNVKLKLYGFTLISFKHINTVNPDANWATFGQAGDKRIYLDGVGEIYVNNQLKFRAVNCLLTVTIPYPTAQQCNNLYMRNGFQNDIGTGLAVTGYGRGTIDVNSSDNLWVDELDHNNTGQVEFDLSTISSIVQSTYGYFDFDIQVIPSDVEEVIGFRQIPFFESTTVDISECDVSFLFNSVTAKDDTLRHVYANKIKTSPTGTLPTGIENICEQFYWELGTNLVSFDADVTFDISEIIGVTNPADLRILKRETHDSNWIVWSDYELVSSTLIKAKNVTSFSEFGIGSVSSNNPFPVELTSFEANVINNDVTLTWETATELNNYGFEIERKNENKDWEKIGFIEGNGSSNSKKYYFYSDKNLAYGKYLYRLKQIDNNGNFQFSNQVELEITTLSFKVNQNYPNPFNPNTTISFSLPCKEYVTLKIYDNLGKEIATLVNEELNKGNYEATWDASLYSSGIYFYRLTAGGFSKTLKMLLLK